MKGTVFFRESKSSKAEGKAKKQGTWTYAFSVPKAGGRRRQITKGGFATKKAAEDALVVSIADHGRSTAPTVEPSKIPLATYMRDQWLPLLAELKPSTRNSYRFVTDVYIAPRIGDVRLCDLTAAQISKLYADLRTSGRVRVRKDGKPLSELTIHKCHVVLNSALGHAVEAGLLRVSPMAALPKKHRPKQVASKRREMHVWTADEARRFLAASAGNRHASIYDLALNTGLRRGELAGLRWEDVDLDAAVIRVRRNRVAVAYEVSDGVPKSGRARVVDLDPDTVTMLRAHRRRQLEERMAWGEAWTDTGFVFTREDGTAYHPDTLSWHLERLVKASGVPKIRLHDLRHTHATLGLSAGVPVKVMQERLGHASSQITLDLYQHVIPGMGADAATKIGGLLRRAQ